MVESPGQAIYRLLHQLYGPADGLRAADRLTARLDRFKQETKRDVQPGGAVFNQRDVVLIAYPDMLQREGAAPLESLGQFIRTWLSDLDNIVHILPFFPSSSDAGFAVVDYESVDPSLGSWRDIETMQADGCRLMLDAVVNHVSAQSTWFRAFREGDPRYADYFIRLDPTTDLTSVTRPRAHPLLTPVETVRGTEYVWTTFGPDQVDLNYKNPDTLLDVMDILLGYIEHGADIIRLDAIAYLWKEIGTPCIHLPQVHWIVQLIRALVDEVAPQVALLTETNVPHAENVSYFGDGSNEAHLVYNFSLPPLIAHAVLSGSALCLTEWARGMSTPSEATAFLNFTASHDGVGLMPVHGILSDDEIRLLIDRTLSGGGAISSKTNRDGSSSPYELNISYFDLINAASDGESPSLLVKRFIVSQAVMLALAGLPAIYLHSLLGSRNFPEGVRQTGAARSINREKLDAALVEEELSQPGNLRRAVFEAYRVLIRARTRELAFHPHSDQHVRKLDERIFAIQRADAGAHQIVLGLHNVSAEAVPLDIPVMGKSVEWKDLISRRMHRARDGNLSLQVPPYGVVWLKNQD